MIFLFLFFVLRQSCLECEYVFIRMDRYYSTFTFSVPSHLSFSLTYIMSWLHILVLTPIFKDRLEMTSSHYFDIKLRALLGDQQNNFLGQVDRLLFLNSFVFDETFLLFQSCQEIRSWLFLGSALFWIILKWWKVQGFRTFFFWVRFNQTNQRFR